MSEATDRDREKATAFFAVPNGRDGRDIEYLAYLFAAARENGRQEMLAATEEDRRLNRESLERALRMVEIAREEGRQEERARCAGKARGRSNYSGPHPFKDIAYLIAADIERGD